MEETPSSRFGSVEEIRETGLNPCALLALVCGERGKWFETSR